MSSFPLTNSYFSRWLSHQQPVPVGHDFPWLFFVAVTAWSPGADSSAWTAMSGRAALRIRRCLRTTQGMLGDAERSINHHPTSYMCIFTCNMCYTNANNMCMYIYIIIYIYWLYMWSTFAYLRIVSIDLWDKLGLGGVYHIIHKRCWTLSESTVVTRAAIMERVQGGPSFMSVQGFTCKMHRCTSSRWLNPWNTIWVKLTITQVPQIFFLYTAKYKIAPKIAISSKHTTDLSSSRIPFAVRRSSGKRSRRCEPTMMGT